MRSSQGFWAGTERYRSGHNGADSKSDGRVKPARGFESHPLRHHLPRHAPAASLRRASTAVHRACLPGHSGAPQRRPGEGPGPLMVPKPDIFSRANVRSGRLNLGARPLRAALSTAIEHSQDGIQYPIELLAHVRGEKAQDEVAILLQELVLAPVPPIRLGVRQMLAAIELNDQTAPPGKGGPPRGSRPGQTRWVASR